MIEPGGKQDVFLLQWMKMALDTTRVAVDPADAEKKLEEGAKKVVEESILGGDKKA